MRALWSCCFVACLMLSLTLPALAAQPIGQVISLQPGVTVEREGKSLPLAVNDRIYLQDVLRTDATGKAQILFTDDSTVALAPQAAFAVQEYADAGGDSRFKGNLSAGLARFITGKIVENNPVAYGVTTPEGTIGIRGTIFAVNTQNGSTSTYVLNVMKGGVTVNGINVPSNYMLTVPGQLTPQRMTPEQRQEVIGATSIARSGGVPTPGAQTVRAGVSPLPGAAGQPDTFLAHLPQADLLSPQVDLPLQQTLGPNLTNATVSGTLNSTVLGATGAFGFNVNLGSGSITNASMSAVGTVSTFVTGYNLAGGSGVVSGNSFTVNGFSGSGVNVPGYPAPGGSDLVWQATGLGTGTPTPNTSMSGTVNSSGNSVTVNGTYSVDFNGWGTDQGTFAGSGQ